MLFKNKKIIAYLKSMEFTLLWVFLLLSCGMHVAYSYYTQYSYNKMSLEQRVLQMESHCNILADQVLANQFAISNSTDNLSIEIDQLANVLNGRIIVIDANYKIVKDTYTIEQDKYMISSDVFAIMMGEKDMLVMDQEGYVEMMIPIIDSEMNARGVIIMTASTQDVIATNEYVEQQGSILDVMFFILACMLAVFLSKLIGKSMSELNKKLKYMCNGHMDEPVAMKGFKEVEDMSESIDQMLSKLQALENSRQEFVSNVSHELKTPITSMKVLADSLLLEKNVPAEMYREFMVDIVEEIERENAIINDLLTLVKTDKKSTALDIQPVNMNALLEILLKRLRPLAAKRNIEIEYESMREVVAEIDEVKLSLAFSNLIENAIKYNKDDGWVKVSLNADHKYFYVKVQDSGVGIPEDCQEMIFERFYRVDKARTRETGGTGLGLAITRNAILLHKGAIKIYSEPSEGSTFTVRIPLNYIA